MNTTYTDDLHAIARHFTGAEIISIQNYGSGLINDTFLVICYSAEYPRFILQRINQEVFPKPEWVMENIQKLIRHFQNPTPCRQQLTLPEIISTHNSCLFLVDSQQQYWRALSFIDNSTTLENISQISDAEQVGSALGEFHCRVANLVVANLHDTLPGFHITPQYLENYHQTKPANKKNPDIRFCQQFIGRFQNQAHVLEKAKQQGLLADRVIHGDPKLNNLLFSTTDKKIFSIIDLDTVKPGLVHYDIGDCLRSCCQTDNPVHFDLDICELILKHYLIQTKQFFTEHDYDYLYPAIELLPFELGLRFFTDYLQGNHYFKTSHPEQNLQRACQQFQLVQSIQEQRPQINKMIKQFKHAKH